MELYNHEDIYDNEISPLMQKIIAICKEHKIPVIASFAYENDEENGVGSCTTNIFFDDRKPEGFLSANREIRTGGNTTMAITVRSA
jgi:hypothetical protein